MLLLHQNVNNHHDVDTEERHKFKTARKMLNTFWTLNIYIENTCIYSHLYSVNTVLRFASVAASSMVFSMLFAVVVIPLL